MSLNKIVKGTPDWDVPLNANFDEAEQRLAESEGKIIKLEDASSAGGDSVKYTAQVLSEEQKKQVRTNVGAIAAVKLGNSVAGTDEEGNPIVPTSSEELAGLVRRATDQEVKGGVSSDTFVTPKQVSTVIGEKIAEEVEIQVEEAISKNTNSSGEFFVAETEDGVNYTVNAPKFVMQDRATIIVKFAATNESEAAKIVINSEEPKDLGFGGELVQIGGLDVSNITTLYYENGKFECDRVTYSGPGGSGPGGTKAILYGYKIAKTDANPEAIVYTDDALGMTAGSSEWWSKWPFNEIKPIMFKGGLENYDLLKTDTSKKADGTSADITTGNDGDVMTRFPQIWLSIKTESDEISVKISNMQVDDTFVCYQEMRGGEHKGVHYIGCYKGNVISSKLRSLSGEAPTVSQTIGAFRTNARANGAGYEINYLYNEIMLEALFMLFYKTRDAQTAIGRGYTGASAASASGATNAKGNGGNYGSTSATDKMKFLWIEDWYGNVWEFIDGLVTKASVYYTSNDPNNFSDAGTGYTEGDTFVGLASGRYITDVHGNNETGFLPKAVDGSETTHYCDMAWFASGDRIARFGGFQGSAGVAGAFCWHVDYAASGASSYVGARLCFV